MDKQYGKTITWTQRIPKVDIHLESLRAILKKVPNWKTPDLDSIHEIWLKKIMSIHDRLTLQ